MAEPEHKRWYRTYRWQKIRARQLAKEPLCKMCLIQGISTIATVCDHRDPHRGDETKFWSGPFDSLCATHHSSDKQRIENGNQPRPTIGLSGWPE